MTLDAIARLAKKPKLKFLASNPKIKNDTRCFGGLAFLSKWPVQPVKLECYNNPDIAIRVHRSQDVPFLLINLHLQSGDFDFAQQQFEILLPEMLSLGIPAIFIGDWNLVPAKSAVAFYEARVS